MLIPLCGFAGIHATLQFMRKKATIYIDAELWRATKVRAAREDKADYQVIEESLRAHLGYDIIDELWERNRENGLNDDSALQFAYSELSAVRRARSKHA